MKRTFLLAILLLIAATSLYSQSFWDSVNATRADAIENGYRVLDEGEGSLSYHNGLQFEIYRFYPGEYLVLVFVNNCTNCTAYLTFQRNSTSPPTMKYPKMVYRNNYAATRYDFRETKTQSGLVNVYTTDQYTSRTSYVILMKRN